MTLIELMNSHPKEAVALVIVICVTISGLVYAITEKDNAK